MSMEQMNSGMSSASAKAATKRSSASASSPRNWWFTCSMATGPTSPASRRAAPKYASAVESEPPDTMSSTAASGATKS